MAPNRRTNASQTNVSSSEPIPNDSDLKQLLNKLEFVQKLEQELQPICVSKLLHARDAAFSTPKRRRTTRIKDDLEKAKVKIEKREYDLSWLPADCLPFLLQENIPSAEFIKKHKVVLLDRLSESVIMLEEEAEALKEKKGGPNKDYDAAAFASAIFGIYREFGGQNFSATYIGDVGWTSELYLFALRVYGILLPSGLAPHQWAVTKALKEVTKSELVRPKKKLRTWLNKRDIGPPMRDRKIIS